MPQPTSTSTSTPDFGNTGEKRFSKPEMEALQFDPRKKTLSLTKTELPAIIDKHEVIVRVTYAGVCGTDLHIMDGSFPCRGDRAFILGHEFCGVASSIGAEVKHIKRGDRVAVDPQSSCGTCCYCTSGRYHQCPSGGLNTTLGIFNNGGWAQFCKVPAKQVYQLPESITFQQAVLSEPLSCVCHAWDLVSPLPIGTSVLVCGAGIIGNLWTCVLHHTGHRSVTVSEPSLVRRTFNERLNTGFKCCSPEELKALKASNPQWGVDLCVDCSGNGRAIEEAVSLLNPCGKLCIFGVASPNEKISIAPFEIFRKELTIFGVTINQFSFQKALSLIQAMGSSYLDYEKLGIQVFPLEKYQEAFDALRKGLISKAIFKLTPGPD
uniref:Enoyl reductase (ER) domain-containing protein n=1 Tax=Cuerna arida TaxID=1464854 RepID=A0A1B6FK96_9HEMI